MIITSVVKLFCSDLTDFSKTKLISEKKLFTGRSDVNCGIFVVVVIVAVTVRAEETNTEPMNSIGEEALLVLYSVSELSICYLYIFLYELHFCV